eukprot:COSAG02_NODE_7808_length_2837_cov_3.525201_2_plen_484_part_00
MAAVQVAGVANPETTVSSMHGQKLSTGVGFWDTAVSDGGVGGRPGSFWGNRSSKVINPAVHSRPTTLGAEDFARRLSGAGPESEEHRRMSQMAQSVLTATAISNDGEIAPTVRDSGHGLVHIGGKTAIGEIGDRAGTLAARVPRADWDALDWAANDQTRNPRGPSRIEYLEARLAEEKLKCPDTADGGHRSGVHPGGHVPTRDTFGAGAVLGRPVEGSLDNPTWQKRDPASPSASPQPSQQRHVSRRLRASLANAEQSPAGSGVHHQSPRETDRFGNLRKPTPASSQGRRSRNSSDARQDWQERMALAQHQEKISRQKKRRSKSKWEPAPAANHTRAPRLDMRGGAPGTGVGGERALPEPQQPDSAQKQLIQRLGYTTGPLERASLKKPPGGHSGDRSSGFSVAHLHAVQKSSHFDRTLDLPNEDTWMHELCNGRSSTMGQPARKKAGHHSSAPEVSRGAGARAKPNRSAVPQEELQRRQVRK